MKIWESCVKGRKELSVLLIFVKLLKNLKNKRLKTTKINHLINFFLRQDLKNLRNELSMGNDSDINSKRICF